MTLLRGNRGREPLDKTSWRFYHSKLHDFMSHPFRRNIWRNKYACTPKNYNQSQNTSTHLLKPKSLIPKREVPNATIHLLLIPFALKSHGSITLITPRMLLPLSRSNLDVIPLTANRIHKQFGFRNHASNLIFT